jgi:hypothetical protein
MSDDSTTQREIAQNQVNLDTARTLGEISSDVKTVLNQQDTLFKMYAGHEKRIAENEKAHSNINVKIGGVGAFIGAVFYALAGFIWNRFFHKQ